MSREAFCINRGERIRTSDLLVPNETRYQAALHPVLRNLGASGTPRRGRTARTIVAHPGAVAKVNIRPEFEAPQFSVTRNRGVVV